LVGNHSPDHINPVTSKRTCPIVVNTPSFLHSVVTKLIPCPCVTDRASRALHVGILLPHRAQPLATQIPSSLLCRSENHDLEPRHTRPSHQRCCASTSAKPRWLVPCLRRLIDDCLAMEMLLPETPGNRAYVRTYVLRLVR